MTMPEFAAGAVACALFLGSMQLLFDANTTGAVRRLDRRCAHLSADRVHGLIALPWGTRGATLAAFAGALIAHREHRAGRGPVRRGRGLRSARPSSRSRATRWRSRSTGLLIAVLAARQRSAVREARDWQTRFEAAIGAHRLVAYEWDPASGAFVVTGDTASLVGVPPAQHRDARRLAGARGDRRTRSRCDALRRARPTAGARTTLTLSRAARRRRAASR